MIGAGTSHAATGEVTGTVFRDYNANGAMEVEGDAAIDIGIPEVGITAYDTSGTEVGSATTGPDGTYTLSYDTGDDSTDVRLEFDVPEGLSPTRSGYESATSGTTVQFVSAGDVADLGLVEPGEIWDENTLLATAQQQKVASGVVTDTLRSVITFGALDTGTGQNGTTEALMGQTGSVWGIATFENTHIFSAAMFRRGTPVGPGGLGQIYLTEVGGDPDASPWVSIPDAGTDPRPPEAYLPDSGYEWARDGVAYGPSGRIGLGAIALADDGSALYVVNLNDSQLYTVPITVADGAPVAGAPTAVPLPTAPECEAGMSRPWGVDVTEEGIFVTATCTGPADADLAGHVFFRPAGETAFQPAPIVTIDLGAMARGQAGDFASANALPWNDDTYLPPGGDRYVDTVSAPQLLVSSVAVDHNGISIGIKDRFADQNGSLMLPPLGGGGPLDKTFAAGDILRACGSVADGFTLESNGSCGGAAGEGVGNGEGPDGGEFYDDDFEVSNGNKSAHRQSALGAVLQLPGHSRVTTTAYDPSYNSGPGSFGVSGIRRASLTDGDQTPATNLELTHATADNDPNNFRKSGGLGDLDVLLLDPVEIGNRVWFDADEDGVQDAGEDPVAGVVVALQCVDGATGTTTTNEEGLYYFNDDNVEPGLAAGVECTVTFDPSETIASMAELTAADAGSNDAIDSDAEVVDGVVMITLTTPAAGADHTFDVGFIPPELCSVGDFVWQDLDSNGVQNPDESGISDVTVTLIDPETQEPVAWMDPTATDDEGFYQFVDVPCGEWQIEFSGIPDDTTFTTPGAGEDDTVDSNATPDTDDPTRGMTEVFTLEPTENDIDNPTIDAGVTEQCSIGDYVWYDTSSNGQQDGDEIGVEGVTVTLLDADGEPVSWVEQQVTGDDGGYLFSALPCGDYQVQFSGIPDGYVFTTPNAPGVDDGIDSDAAPTEEDPTIAVTATYTLGADPEDPADNDDPTVDAGVVQICTIGDYVWQDLDRDGVQDDGEPGVPGVTVTLIDPETDEPVEGVNPEVSGDDGVYTFTVPCGDYMVEFSDLPEGFDFTEPEVGEDDAVDSNVTPDPEDPGVGTTPPVTVGDETPDDPTVDAGLVGPVCSVGNYVWFDLNNNGLQDAAEPAVDGVTVTLLDGEGEAVPGVEPATTSGGGWYVFDGLACADYQVAFTDIPNGYGFTTQSAGADSVDSDADPATGITRVVTLGPGETGSRPTTGDDQVMADYINPDLDAGIVEICSIGDFVWFDEDADGVQDDGEVGIPGVTVTLIDPETGEPVAGVDPQVTGDDGRYVFEGVACGTYVVEFSEVPEEYVPSDPEQGDDRGVDSNVDPEPVGPGTYRTPPVTVGEDPEDPGDNDDPTIDAGFETAICSIGDYVWFDADRDGIQDPDESGVPGVTVTLVDPETGEPVAGVDPQVTGDDGEYGFVVPCGSYLVEFSDIPDGYGFTDPNAGDDDAVDSDVTPDADDPSTGRTPATVLGGDEPSDDPTLDAGLVAGQCSLGDFVWFDADGDGQQDAGEDPVSGVTVTLLDPVTGEPVAGVDPQVTDDEGRYVFSGIECGSYRVQFSDVPDGWVFTDRQVGDPEWDSDADADGLTDVVVLSAADRVDLSVDAGLVAAPKLGATGGVSGAGVALLAGLVLALAGSGLLVWRRIG